MGQVAEGSGTQVEGAGLKVVVSGIVTSGQMLCRPSAVRSVRRPYPDYQGKRVCFCCPDCMAKFKSSPEKYMKKLAKKWVALKSALAAAESKYKAEWSRMNNEGSGKK